MENIISHLEAAQQHVSSGLSALGVSTSQGGHQTDPLLGPNSDLPHYNPGISEAPELQVGPNTDLPHYDPGLPNAPEQNVGPNTDLPHYNPQANPVDPGNANTDDLGPSDTAGFDHVFEEHEIDSFGTEAEDGPLVDSVSVYEYDLGEFSDSVHSIDLSAVPGDAELNFLGYDVNGAAIVSVGADGLVLTLEGEAAAYIVQLNAGGEVGPLGVSVEALVGASAHGSADFVINPMQGDFKVEIQAGVVVGATIDANGELELGHITVEGGVTGVAGFAADVNLDVGFEDWEFEFDAGGKLAFLLGGGVDVSFSLDGKEIVADLGDAGRVVWDQGGNIIGGAIDVGGEILEFGGDVGGAVLDFGGDVGGTLVDGGGVVLDTLTFWD